MKFTNPALLLTLLALVPSSLAQKDCTKSTAQKYNDPSIDPCGAAAINRDSTGCVKQYCANGGTSASLNVCFCLAGLGENCGGLRKGRDVESLDKRATFQCSSSRTCYIYPVDGGLFCLDGSTGDYNTDSGDSGNVNTGAYTAAPVGGASTADSPTSTKTTSTSRSSAPVVSSAISSNVAPVSTTSASSNVGAVTTGASSQGASTTAKATSATGAAASSTSSASGGQISAGAILGALGLVAQFVI